MPLRKIATFCAMLPLTALAACGTEGADANGFAVRDSAGIQIVENTAPGWRDGTGWSINPEPLLDIGVVDGAPEYQLSRITDARQLASGQIAVVNGGSQEIRYYDASGAYLRSIGGKGGGPGEFQVVTWIQPLPGDSLLAYDALQRRLTTFDSQGTLIGTSDFTLNGPNSIPQVENRFPDGTLLVRIVLVPGSDEVKGGVIRAPVRLVRYSADHLVVDTVARLLGVENFNGGMIRGPLIFGASYASALSGDSVFAANNDTYEIGVYTVAGKLERLIRRSYPPRPVPQSYMDSVTQRRKAAGANSAVGAILKAMPIPSTLPAFGDFLADDAGDLWVEDYDPKIVRGAPLGWTVFDPEGRMLGRPSMPDRFEPMQIGDDFVLGVWKDDLDVEHVRMYALAKPT